MQRQTKRLLEEAFNIELDALYNCVLESVARELSGMQEISGLHSSEEVFSYLNGAAEVISIVFGVPDSRLDIARIVCEIESSHCSCGTSHVN